MTRSRTSAFATALLAAGAMLAATAEAGGGHRHHTSHGHGYAHGHGHGHGHGHKHGHPHRRSGLHIGFAIGAPLAAGVLFHHAHPHVTYHHAPRVVVVPTPSVTYIQQPLQGAAPAETRDWWYWCPSANAYHPYVSDCPGGWQRVAPQPPPPR